MKTLAMPIFLGFLVISASAQQLVASNTTIPTNTTLTEPEFTGQVCLTVLDGLNCHIERQQPQPFFKAKAMGFTGAQYGFEFQGASSPTKVGPKPEFVAKFPTIPGAVDPSTMVMVDRLSVDPKANVRRFSTISVGGMVVSKVKKGTPTADTTVELRFKKSGDVVKFAPASPLAAGEYLIRFGPEAHLFHVEK